MRPKFHSFLLLVMALGWEKMSLNTKKEKKRKEGGVSLLEQRFPRHNVPKRLKGTPTCAKKLTIWRLK